MNKLNKQILVAVFIAIAISTSYAQAGLLDLFTNSNVQDAQASSQSFDQLYVSTMTPADNAMDGILMGSLVAMSSPSGKAVAKVTRRTIYVQVSGYNSEVGQTDDSPFITANGTHVRDGIVAANIIDSNGYNIPFNTIIKFKNCGSIPEDKIFTVTDRLNKRYTNNVDIWFASHSDALKFGRRNCQIEIVQ